MSPTNYQRGYANEYRVIRLFEKMGYIVMRSGGSKSPFDFVVFRPDRVPLVIQTKSVDGLYPIKPNIPEEILQDMGRVEIHWWCWARLRRHWFIWEWYDGKWRGPVMRTTGQIKEEYALRYAQQ